MNTMYIVLVKISTTTVGLTVVKSGLIIIGLAALFLFYDEFVR